MSIKIVALDAYGTFLASDDYENQFPVRKGLEEFFQLLLLPLDSFFLQKRNSH